MKIWIDADACPVAVKNIIYKAADRTQTYVTLVTNQILQAPPSPYIKIIRVMAGFDVADNEIVNRMSSGDLIVTADIPLADAVVEKDEKVEEQRGRDKRERKQPEGRESERQQRAGDGGQDIGPPGRERKQVIS